MKQPSYSLIDELMASPTEPLAENKRAAYMNKAWVAYHVMAGDSPSYAAADICVDIISMVQSLVAMDVVEDASGLLLDAQSALGHCVQHYPEGIALSLTEDGAHAVSAVLEDYAEALAQVPARIMVRCHRRAEKARLVQIKNSRMKREPA